MSGLRLRVLTPEQFCERRATERPVLMAASPSASALDQLVPCVLEQWDEIDAYHGQWLEVSMIQIGDPNEPPPGKSCG